jgi:hypothetical protein
MWSKTIEVSFKGEPYQVQIWLNDSNEHGQEAVRQQSMMNEFFLVEDVYFDGRDAAYDFIKNYPHSMAKAFLIRAAYDNQAVQP